MIYVLNIYKTDKRTKGGEIKRGSYRFNRPDLASMEREANELRSLYREKDGFRLEIKEADNDGYVFAS